MFFLAADKQMEVWGSSIYIYILKGCVVTGDSDLALHMLSEMQRMGRNPRRRQYEISLKIVRKPHHLDHFLPVRRY